MSHNIEVEGGKSLRLLTAGKYCDRDIVVTATGGGGGGSSILPKLLEDATFEDTEITEIGVDLFRGWQYITKLSLPNVTNTVTTGYLCYGCTKLEEVYMPKCTTLGAYAFYNNTNLKAIDFPKLTAVPANGFRQCTSAISVNLPVCTSLGTYAFQKCSLVEKLDFPMLASIATKAFDQCSELTALILRVNKVCTLANAAAFDSTPIKSGTGYIYVQPALVSSYQSASNWSTYASQFRPKVATAADLASIDGAVYDRAWVDDEYCVYTYDGSAWAKGA